MYDLVLHQRRADPATTRLTLPLVAVDIPILPNARSSFFTRFEVTTRRWPGLELVFIVMTESGMP